MKEVNLFADTWTEFDYRRREAKRLTDAEAEAAQLASEEAYGVKSWLLMMGDDVEVHSASVLESYVEQYDEAEVLFIEAIVVYCHGTFKELWSSDLSDCEDWMCNESWPAKLPIVALL